MDEEVLIHLAIYFAWVKKEHFLSYPIKWFFITYFLVLFLYQNATLG